MATDLTGAEAAPELGRALWAGPPDDPRRYRVAVGADGPETVGGGGEGLVYQATCEIEGEERQVALKLHTAVAATDYPRIVARAESSRSSTTRT